MIPATICIVLVCIEFSFLGGAVGIIRFPDFYAACTPRGKGDTMSVFLILMGLAAYQLADFNLANLLVAGKILFITIFIMWASPTAPMP